MREGTWLPWASMGKGGQGVRANGMSTGYTLSPPHTQGEKNLQVLQGWQPRLGGCCECPGHSTSWSWFSPQGKPSMAVQWGRHWGEELKINLIKGKLPGKTQGTSISTLD